MTDFSSLIENFRQKGISLTELESLQLCNHFKASYVKKKQFVVQPNFVNKYRTYIVKGTFRGYVVDNKGQEHTISFAMDDWWVSDFDSYINQKPATMFVVALEDSLVLQIDRADEEALNAAHHKFETYFRINAENDYPVLYTGFQYKVAAATNNLSNNRSLKYRRFCL